jgi:hypothetical protein
MSRWPRSRSLKGGMFPFTISDSGARDTFGLVVPIKTFSNTPSETEGKCFFISLAQPRQ